MLMSLLFRCRNCDCSPSLAAFPLCEACAGFLRPAPLLCRRCGGPDCPPAGACLRPWESTFHQFGIESHTARYLNLEPGYSVLKSWKKHGGPLFDRRILTSNPAYFRELAIQHRYAKAQAVIPIPQKFSRSWVLGRSPAETVARWLSQGLRMPLLLNVLELQSGFHRKRRQAELSFHERIGSRHGFEARSEIIKSQGLSNIILVDDFMTSGRTLRSAARVLFESGVQNIQIFVLGYRPRRIKD